MTYPPSQKPPIWSIDPGVIAYNCQNAGFPHPVGACPMWEGAGNVARDYSGNGNNGSFAGNPVWKGDGLYFDGVNDRVDMIGASVQDISLYSSFTISFLTKRAPGSSSYEYIYSNEGGTGRNLLFIDSSSRLVFQLSRSVTAQYRVANSSSSFPADDSLRHIIVMWDGGTAKTNMQIYVDGTEITYNDTVGQDGAGTINSQSNTIIAGRVADNTRNFNGTMYESHMYNTILTQAQIKFLCNDPYFMYRIPEELYGYSPAVFGAIINQFQKANIGADLYNGAIIA